MPKYLLFTKKIKGEYKGILEAKHFVEAKKIAFQRSLEVWPATRNTIERLIKLGDLPPDFKVP